MTKDLTIPQQKCLRLLRLMASPKAAIEVGNLVSETDRDGNRYGELLLRLHDKGYINYDRTKEKCTLKK